MTRNQKLKCTSDHRELRYKPHSIKVQIDPLGMSRYMISTAQSAAWKYGWLEACNYEPQEFCDRIYELSLYRRRHGCQITQIMKAEWGPRYTTQPTFCCFRIV